MAANLTGAYLARNPGVLQEGFEGTVAFVQGYSETPGSVPEKLLNGTASGVMSALPSTPIAVYQVKALSKAQGANYTGFKVKICVESEASGAVAVNNPIQRRTLYHYTDEGGLNGISGSNSLWASTKGRNPNDVRYGNGQYVSDFAPWTKTPSQLSREFLGQPFQGKRFTHYTAL